MKKLSIILLMLILPSASLFAIKGSVSIVSNGVTRTFVFYAPGTSVAASLPLMIVLHGLSNTGSGIEGYSGFDSVASKQNFLVVYPDALNNHTWNAYISCPKNNSLPDDVKFISDLIDYMYNTYGINKTKVYVAGHSQGGVMAYNLMIELPTKIAAFAPVSAVMTGNSLYYGTYLSSRNYVKVPIYHIHGDADATINYPDPNNVPDTMGEWPIWRFSNGDCGAKTYSMVTDIVPNVKKLSFCDAGSGKKEVCLIRIVGGNHNWPSVAGYDAATAIWAFCNQYQITPINWTTNPTCQLILGVSGLSLQGTVSVVGNQLQWQTLAEQQNKGFEVQRSTDATNFVALAFVQSKTDKGNSTKPLNYDFIDGRPNNGQNFYRLKQTDLDGNFAFSNTVVINNNAAGKVALWPNPVMSILNLAIPSNVHQFDLITITDAQGKVQLRQREELHVGQNTVSVNLTGLANGNYLLYVNGSAIKFVKQ